MDVRQVSLNRPGDSNMFCGLGELYWNSINFYWVDESLISDSVFVARGREGEKLGLLRS